MSALIRGADISSLPELEYHGGLLLADGAPCDGLQLLQQTGLNAVRIKVWNDPGCPDHFPSNQTAYPRQLHPQRNAQWLLQHTGSEPYPATPEGQAQFLAALGAVVRAVPGGLGQGIFYWEPALLPLPDGSRGVWQNATLFADDGTVLPGLAALGQL